MTSQFLEQLKEILRQRQAQDLQQNLSQPGGDIPAPPQAQMPMPQFGDINRMVGRPNPETAVESQRLSAIDSEMNAPKKQDGFWMGLLRNTGQALAYGDKLPQMRVQQGQLERQKRMDLANEADRIRQGIQQRQQGQFQIEAANRAEAGEEREAQLFPAQRRTAEAQAAATERPPAAVQPREIDVFTNNEGKRVVVRQMPDGTLKAEPQGDVQGPQKIPGRDVPLPPDVVDQKIDMENRSRPPVAPREPGPYSQEAIDAAIAIAEGKERAKTVGAGGAASPYSIERAKRTIQSIDELDKKVSSWTVGYGSLLSNVPESESANFEAELTTLKAAIAQNELAQMREASKTGGALGAVSEKEIRMLENSLGALDRKQKPENFKAQLAKIKGSIERWQAEIAKTGAQPPAPQGQGGGAQPPQASGPKIIRFDAQGNRIP